MDHSKIIQIVTAAPITPMSAQPYLFALTDDGQVLFWNWIEDCFMPIECIND